MGAVFAVLVALGLVAVGAFLFYKHRIKRRHDAKLEPDSPYSRNDEVYDELSYVAPSSLSSQ